MTSVSPGGLLPLFPQVLRRARRGNPVLPRLQRDTGLSHAELRLLREVAGGPPVGITTAQLRPGAPYATRDSHLSCLDAIRNRGYLHLDAAGHWRVTDDGMVLGAQLERGLVGYVATLNPPPGVELAALADALASIARRMDEEVGGPGGRLAAARRLACLAASNAPMARLEQAVRELWLARDDAHQRAWRAAWFNGPSVDILTRLWQGEAETRIGLEELLAATHEPPTVRDLVDELVEQGYVEARGDELTPTRAGYLIRETIEAETDQLYFLHWPELADSEVARIHAGLRATIDALPGE